ncbi:DUF2147 domain-containing protein [Acinetobacter sp. ANC 4277]|uniref:DUF2147 domain-containing protein n=1 Tax=Acinetobacter terrae TaxID=2731247 RepID=UPI00182C92EF|nr:DUF2147 domain-containing protein [Acinetobacter terrae]NNG77040.1 DUF2147 domain-containing protein [Acinetobacter terrae]
MNTKITLSGLVPIASSMIHAETADLAGSWKTIDDKTRYARADVLITKQKNGINLEEIIKVHTISNLPAIDHSEKCKGTLKNAPLISLPIFSGFKQKPKNKDEFIDGHVLDPLSGHIYQGKGRLNARENVLTLRGFIGTSLLGRTVSWIRTE